MRTLIISAHPSTEGFTHRIASAYATGAREKGSEVHMINLYDQRWRQDFLYFDDPKDIAISKEGEAIREQIAKATELIFVFPMWWFGMPAIMKNFFDHNFGAGFAFTFEDGKPKGLLGGKVARIYATADGPGLMYKLTKPFFAVPITRGILGFCGVKTLSVEFLSDRVKWKGTEKEQKILADVTRVARTPL